MIKKLVNLSKNRSRRLVLIIISSILLMLGSISIMDIPSVSDDDWKNITLIFDDNEIEWICLTQKYIDQNKSTLNIKGELKDTFSENTVDFLFNDKVKIVEDLFDDSLDSYVVKMDKDKYYLHVCPDLEITNKFNVTVSGDFFSNWDGESEYILIYANTLLPGSDLAVEYLLISPAFSEITIDGNAPDYRNGTIYRWNDIRYSSDSVPAVLRIKTAQLIKRNSINQIIGTILFTVGLTLIIEMLIGLLAKRDVI